ncbi:hypothetical protein TNCV_2181061 [Trichonephila clavipes]|uniref:Mos1 transposase HTH domain-containing protein n=1 Tax=Trichonephila clavipes TaxID=2585209 RepID=A0A8X7B7Z7_TRICX|nr:hypothetical protein TNCV_2181061 [Trichonephila clavipes]
MVFSFKENSPAAIHLQLVNVYGTSVMSQRRVLFWCSELDKGSTDVQRKEKELGDQVGPPQMTMVATSKL